MVKKLISIVLTGFILNLSFLPVFAEYDTESSKIVIDTHLVSDINVNKSNKGQVVQFISNRSYTTNQGIEIPEGTLFNAEIASLKKSRFAFRRAKAKIDINEMVFPNGQKYKIKGHTKRHVYKGSAIGNTAKGIVATPAAIVFGAAGCVIIVVEAVSIVGIILIGPTSAAFGGAIGKLTNGVNCKIEQGTDIPIKINTTKLKVSPNYKKTDMFVINENKPTNSIDINESKIKPLPVENEQVEENYSNIQY